jgi:hypothetical protein
LEEPYYAICTAAIGTTDDCSSAGDTFPDPDRPAGPEPRSQQRQHNIDNLQQFLSSPLAQKAMKDANINPRQVQNAIPALSDQDLAQLSARADKAQTDFAAGDLSQRDILLIILAVVVLVLIIVAVR